MKAAQKKETYAERWLCGTCGSLHDDEDYARECCKPSVKCVLICVDCGKRFKEGQDKEAAACHPEIITTRCLCGNIVDERDEDPSALLGSLVWCADCREQIVAGVPAPVARDRTFTRNIGGAA